tara:strand:- start:349 stop:654 length:306 start_codon:yes stop_codon:yes gene_type:complete
MTIADTIYQQLGGGRFAAMTGAKNFISDGDSLHMRIGRNKTNNNYLIVTLNGKDLYDMEFGQVTKMAEKRSVKTYTDVYCDGLRQVFESHTGMYTSLFGEF